MKKIYLSLIALAAMTIVACGGASKSNEQAEAPAEASELAAEPQTEQKFDNLADVTDANYTELVKAICGVDPNPAEGLKISKAYGSPGNANLMFEGAKGIEERDLQKAIFERCQAVADDGTIYTIKSDPQNGIQKGEPIKTFDDFKGINWAYGYNGQVYTVCVQKPGGMKSIDKVEVRFGV